MRRSYYNTPIQFNGIIHGEHADQCDIRKSIYQHLFILLSTRKSEFVFDDHHEYETRFGNIVWDFEFEILPGIVSNSRLTQLARTLKKTIKHYERRLSDVDVELQVDDVKIVKRGGGPSAREVQQIAWRKQMTITVSGNLGSEPWREKYLMCFAP